MTGNRTMRLSFLAAVWGVMVFPAIAANNVHFTGNLLSDICVPVIQDNTLEVHFPTADAGKLAAGIPSTPVPVVLQLTQCGSILTRVTVTLQGVESAYLSGFLALDSGSSASGISIGLQTEQGQSVSINSDSGASFPLTTPDSTLNLNAWLQAEPGREVVAGTFTATMTATFEYY